MFSFPSTNSNYVIELELVDNIIESSVYDENDEYGNIDIALLSSYITYLNNQFTIVDSSVKFRFRYFGGDYTVKDTSNLWDIDLSYNNNASYDIMGQFIVIANGNIVTLYPKNSFSDGLSSVVVDNTEVLSFIDSTKDDIMNAIQNINLPDIDFSSVLNDLNIIKSYTDTLEDSLSSILPLSVSLNGDHYSYKDGTEVLVYPNNSPYTVQKSYLVN